MDKGKKRKRIVRQAVQQKIHDSSIPHELRERDQWTLMVPKDEDGNRPSYDPNTLNYARSNDPDTWGSYELAAKILRGDNRFCNLNFTLSYKDPYVGFDLDHCREGSEIEPWAAEIVKALDSYTEISPSGTGLRVFIKGKIPGVRRKKGDLEMYDTNKFLSVTGNHLSGTPKEIYERQEPLNQLHYKTFGDDKPKRTAVKIDEPARLEDHRVIKQARKGSDKFRRLYKGKYKGDYPSRSDADMAFFGALSHYTKNREQAKRIFEKSKLCTERDWSKKTWKPYVDTIIDRVFVDDPGNPWAAIEQDEVGDANLLMHLFKDRYCKDHSAAKWYQFRDNFWTEDYVRNPDTMPGKLIEVYGEEYAKLEPLVEDEANTEKKELYINMQKGYLRRIKQLQKKTRRSRVVALSIEGDGSLGISGKEWDRGAYDLPCKNGVLNLKNGEFRLGKPEDYYKTIVPTGWNKLDYTGDEEWEVFLGQIFDNDLEIIKYLQRLLGMGLIGKTIEHIFPVFMGKGRNGKDTMLEALGEVLGKIAGVIAPELLLESGKQKSADAPSPAIMSLMGKRIVWGSEADEGGRFNPSQVKRLTGGNRLVGRHLYGKHNIDFAPSHLLCLVTNYMPAVSAADYAFWKRAHIINFPLSFVDKPKEEYERMRDPHKKEMLLKDRSAILSWLVRGCIAYQEEGQLNPPEGVKTATEESRSEGDDILLFIEERCVREEGKSISLKDLHPRYKSWCFKEEIKYPLGRNKFRKQMEGRGFTCTTDSYARRWFADLRFKEEEEEYSQDYKHEEDEEDGNSP